MSNTSKRPSDLDGNQTLQNAFNDTDSSLTTNGFLVGKIGHKFTMTLDTTSISNDTEVYDFYDGSTFLYQITVIYTTGTRDVILSGERTA